MSDEKSYYVVSPEDVRGLLEHRTNWVKISQKSKDTEEWLSAGYISWSKTGKTLTIMVAANSSKKQ